MPGPAGEVNPRKMLVVRLGAMGDIVHALPAVATLKHSFPASYVVWVVEPRWRALLEDNPFVNEVVELDRSHLPRAWLAIQQLRSCRFDLAVDLQGLMKSALVAWLARPRQIYGYHPSRARERLAALFYSHHVRTRESHVVDQYLEIVNAAGAQNMVKLFPIPRGRPEGELPDGPFVLASPFAGWAAKQWPLRYYEQLGELLARRLGLPLVLNASLEQRASVPRLRHCHWHFSSLAGLIAATRQAIAVVGIDSGPLHLAAALGKPGVAIYGPTDPARNGPYGNTITVLRSPRAKTSYRRKHHPDPSMLEIEPEAVLTALEKRLGQPVGATQGR